MLRLKSAKEASQKNVASEKADEKVTASIASSKKVEDKPSPADDGLNIRSEIDRLKQFEWMMPGHRLRSKDGRFQFILQEDGNAVLQTHDAALWASNTAGTKVHSLVMHSDGNLAVRGFANEALWETGTTGHQGAYLILQNDGNLVLYHGAKAVWASHTGGR